MLWYILKCVIKFKQTYLQRLISLKKIENSSIVMHVINIMHSIKLLRLSQMFPLITLSNFSRRKPHAETTDFSYYILPDYSYGIRNWRWEHFSLLVESCKCHLWLCVAGTCTSTYVERNVMEEWDDIVREVDFYMKNIQNSLPYSIQHANICIWMTTRKSIKIDFPLSTSYFRFMPSFKNIFRLHSQNLVHSTKMYLHYYCISNIYIPVVIYEHYFIFTTKHYWHFCTIAFYFRNIFRINYVIFSRIISKIIYFF